jgi:hypothetical protein
MWNRDLAIDTIINDDLNSFFTSKDQYDDDSTLAEMLLSGFKGYQNYTDEQLMQELIERDISTVFGEIDG